jgi:uncharacterized delta-60 repeat protein
MIQMKKTNSLLYVATVVCCLVAVFFPSCKKAPLEPVEVYPNPPDALVKFLDGTPSPAIGSEGSVVTYKVNGLKGKEGQFKFFINQTEAEVVSVGENEVKVKVPLNSSTGGCAILINNEYYFGPTFTVRGKVSIDPLFKTDLYRSNGPILGIIENDNSNYMVYGAFTDYQNMAGADNAITGIALVDVNGQYLANNQLDLGKQGFNGTVSQVIQMPDGRYIVSGYFSKYDTTGNVNRIARLNNDGTLETTEVDVINPDPVNDPNGGKAIVPAFNGGLIGGAGGKIFYDDATGYTTAVGNFTAHVSTFYERSTKSGPYLDLVKAAQLLRMKEDGGYDSSFNFNPATNSSYEGGNGFVYDAAQLSDGSLILVGNFTTFHGSIANYITRINAADGKVDATFNSGNSGADGSISRITYNSTTDKILLTGNFQHYNGQPANGVVMINADGSIDNSFSFRKVEGGVANFAGQLSNGKIIVSGSFTKYDNVVRPGLLILNADGSLAAGYNNMGLFRGAINEFIEVPSSNGMPAVIIVGSFDRFDQKEVSNIVKFRMEN